MKYYTINSHVISFEVSCAISYEIIDDVLWAKFHMKFMTHFIKKKFMKFLMKLYKKYHGSFGFLSECGIKKGWQEFEFLHFEDDPLQLFVMASTGFHFSFIQKMSHPWWDLAHWVRVTPICVSKLNIIGWDNGSAPTRRQAIIWTNAGILIISFLGTHFSEVLIEIHTFSFRKIYLNMFSVKWRPFCSSPNVLSLWNTGLTWTRHALPYVWNSS